MRYPTSLSLATIAILAGSTLAAAEPAPAPKPTIAKICTTCHKAEVGVLRGYFDNVSLKSKAIQIKIDDATEVLPFDEKSFQVVNEKRENGDVSLLKDQKLKKGHEVKVEFKEENGVKKALKLTAKPPVELPKEVLLSTSDLEKLVAKGPEKGKYFLFDSRPALRFNEGAIPTAVNLPYPAFDKMAEKLLPSDKNALVIFYCAGVTCNMSPASMKKAAALGYTNVKVYRDGMPAWSEKHYGVLSAQALKETWLDKGMSHVLLDARPAAATKKGFITGAVSFPAAKAAKLAASLKLAQKKAPLIVYDEAGGKDGIKAAQALVKAGYGNVKLLSGGYAAWQKAGFSVATGTMATKAVYVAKPKPGEIEVAEFRKLAASLPDSFMIIDVRTPEETANGMLKNARNVPLTQLRERLSDLPKDKMLLLQCNTGNQAEMAYHTLKELGYSNVRFLNAKTTFAKDGSFTITKD
jgi:rhodanese-related sulfurtransferase